MKKIYTLLCCLILSNIVFSQNNDAATALVVCNDPPLTANPNGTGINDFADPDNHIGCNQMEVSSMWLFFKMDDATPPGTSLGFIINPSAGAPVDYDWAIYGPDVNCGALGDPIRCSSSSGLCGFCPQTGLGMGAMDVSEGPGTGDGFLKLMTVQAGEGYYLFLENITNNGTGFTLNFIEGAEYVDCSASAPCCVNIATSNDVTVCAGDPTFQISATATSINPVTYSWQGTGNSTSFLDDPTSQFPFVTIPDDFSGTIIYTITASDGSCDVVDEVIIKVNPQPQIMINPIGIICSNGGNIQMTGTPQNGLWGGIASPTGVINPFSLIGGTYEVTLSFTNNFGCKGTEEINVEVAEAEDIVIDDVNPLCVNSPAIQLMATPFGGIWSGKIQGTDMFNPKTNGPGLYNIVYTYVNPEGCKSKDSILIEVIDLPAVNITDPGTLCESELVHIIVVSPGGGMWSGVADPAGNVYPKNLGVGSFQIKYSYADQYGCAGKDSLTFKVEAAPFATLDLFIEVCNSINSGKPTTVDFNALITSGDKSGIWTDDNSSGASGTFPVLDFNGITPGNYNFTYTLKSSTGACPDLVKTVQIKVIDCNCPSLSLNGPVDICNSGNSVDLNTYKNTNEVGTWTLTSVPSGTNPATLSGTILNISGKDPGVYTATYTLTNTVPINCTSSNELKINLFAKPIASLPTIVNLCNKPSSNFPNIIDLSSIITAGDKSGTWIDNENSGATGNFNALDFTGITAGIYTFTYTTASAILPCTESSYTVDIIVDDCNCPSLIIDPASNLCSNTGSIDLSTLSSNAAPGNWTLKSKPAGSNPGVLTGNIFTTNSSDVGIYSFTYTLNPLPPAGCLDQKTIDLTVLPEPFTALKSSAKVCNSPIISPDSTKLDFASLIINGDNTGTWIDKNNSGANGAFPVLDFSGVSPGNYTFEYTTGNAVAPCINKTYSISIVVIDCNCPDLSLTPSKELCNSQNTFDLNTLKLSAIPGTWSIITAPFGSNPASISGNILNTSNKDKGLYLLQFTPNTTPPAGCPGFSQSNLTINQSANAGAAAPSIDICQGTKQSIQLNDQLTGEDPSGTWSLSPVSDNPGTAFDQINASLVTDNLNAGTYSFVYLVSSPPPCADTKSTVSIIIQPIYSFDAGKDESFDCSVSSVTLGQNINLPAGYQLTWSGPDISDPLNHMPSVKKAGLYIATITTDKNCVSYDSLSVTITGNPITEIEALVKDASCPEVSNGKIDILNITGGTPAYSYLWSGSVTTTLPQYDQLAEGSYTLQIQDQQGCKFDTILNVLSQKGFTLDLGPDLILDQGTEYSISAIVSIAPNFIDSIIWFPSVCFNCIQIDEKAETNILYKVSAIDVNGCRASDEVQITVIPVRKIFIPNVFSPNADGINDVFFIRSDAGVEEVEGLEIFNRWGSLVFHQEHFQANDPDYGWNGKVKGKYVNNDVFVYWAKVKFTDGEVFIYKGDVTVNR